MEWSAIKARTWSIIFATPLDVLRTRYQALREDVNTEPTACAARAGNCGLRLDNLCLAPSRVFCVV